MPQPHTCSGSRRFARPRTSSLGLPRGRSSRPATANHTRGLLVRTMLSWLFRGRTTGKTTTDTTTIRRPIREHDERLYFLAGKAVVEVNREALDHLKDL